MTVKGLHNFHNNMKAMEENVISPLIQQNGANINNNIPLNRESHLFKNNQSQQPRSPTAVAPTTTVIDNNYSRKEHHIETISNDSSGQVQLREKSYDQQLSRDRDVRSSVSSDDSRDKRSSVEVSFN